jgi:hypothetical protein
MPVQEHALGEGGTRRRIDVDANQLFDLTWTLSDQVRGTAGSDVAI